MEQKTKMSTKKKVSAVVAGVLAVTLALGGAYAWTDYSQNARNTFKGTVAADVLLHDDFDGENKDVYVENTGDSEVFVRVKFAEYLQIGNNSMLIAYGEDVQTSEKKADSDNVATWPVHQFKNDVGEDNTCNLLGTHAYFEWNMTGAQKPYLAGVTEANSDGYGGLSEETFNNLTVGGDVTLGDITTQKKLTSAASPVMMLSDWLALETKPTTPCWLLDTDGWAYWSNALQPGTATNLLLDSVEATDVAPYDNWVYHIDVQLQAATITELDAWYVDGEAEVANPDNSVATATKKGRAFVEYYASDYINIADGTTEDANGQLYISVANNVYVKAKLSDDGTGYVADGDYILAGQDSKIGTDDDDMLAGRSVENGGGIKVRNIDKNAMTYMLVGADDDYVVTAGIDKKLGTYDDVITSTSGALGTYLIDKDEVADKVGWNYLGGPITNMLVATEYVLDNVLYDSPADVDSYKYADSLLKAKIVEIETKMNVTAPVNTVELDMSAVQHIGNQVYICTKVDCDHVSDCIMGFSNYHTVTEAQENIRDTKFFVLSLNEVLSAYGDSTDIDIKRLRFVQAAPKYVHEIPGQGGNGFNYNDSTLWQDGDGNFITATTYWLRSPGYYGTRASYIDASGGVGTTHMVTHWNVGARPACYLDLSTTTTTQ